MSEKKSDKKQETSEIDIRIGKDGIDISLHGVGPDSIGNIRENFATLLKAFLGSTREEKK